MHRPTGLWKSSTGLTHGHVVIMWGEKKLKELKGAWLNFGHGLRGSAKYGKVTPVRGRPFFPSAEVETYPTISVTTACLRSCTLSWWKFLCWEMLFSLCCCALFTQLNTSSLM